MGLARYESDAPLDLEPSFRFSLGQGIRVKRIPVLAARMGALRRRSNRPTSWRRVEIRGCLQARRGVAVEIDSAVGAYRDGATATTACSPEYHDECEERFRVRAVSRRSGGAVRASRPGIRYGDRSARRSRRGLPQHRELQDRRGAYLNNPVFDAAGYLRKEDRQRRGQPAQSCSIAGVDLVFIDRMVARASPEDRDGKLRRRAGGGRAPRSRSKLLYVAYSRCTRGGRGAAPQVRQGASPRSWPTAWRRDPGRAGFPAITRAVGGPWSAALGVSGVFASGVSAADGLHCVVERDPARCSSAFFERLAGGASAALRAIAAERPGCRSIGRFR